MTASRKSTLLALAAAALLCAGRASACAPDSSPVALDANLPGAGVVHPGARASLREAFLRGDTGPQASTTPQVVTHCWWSCVPGDGCEYVCRSYPW